MKRKSDKKVILKDIGLTVLILGAVTALCLLLKLIDNTAAYASMIFIFAVFLISRFTHGYFCGIAASLIGVLLVNFVFTYPYFEFNFTLSGYPIFIVCMLAVSALTSAMTSQNKEQEQVRIETEREKTRSNLLRAVSHDIRTPLTSINGVCSVMIENDDNISKEERLRLLSDMKEDARWLIRVVENLLTITRIDEGGQAAGIVKKPEAVEEIIADCAAKFRKQFPEMPLTVSVPEDFIMLPMDAILIEQVVMNLLENAVIHSASATKVIFAAEDKGDYVEFSVTDNGDGIPPAMLPTIFDGYRGESTPQGSDAKRSMGIGLSVCNTIIKAHSGKMNAENVKGGGARFSFTLPADNT